MGIKSALLLAVLLYVATSSRTNAHDVSEVDDQIEDDVGILKNAGGDAYYENVKTTAKGTGKDAKVPVKRPPTFLARCFKPWIAAYHDVADYVKKLIGTPPTSEEL